MAFLCQKWEESVKFWKIYKMAYTNSNPVAIKISNCPYFGFKCETFLATEFEFVYVITAFYFSTKMID